MELTDLPAEDQAALGPAWKKIQERQESTITSLRSLMLEGKTKDAEALLWIVRGTRRWEEAKEILRPTTTATCPNGHDVGWSWYDSAGTWKPNGCDVCYHHQQEQMRQDAEVRAKQEDRRRQQTYRDAPIEHVEDALVTIGVPSRYFIASVKTLPSLTDSLYLTGARGVGKTHLAAAVVRERVLDWQPYISREHPWTVPSIRWIATPDLLLDIRDSFRDGSDKSERDIIEEYTDCKLLVLDDLGAEKTTEWSLQTLYTIIDRRYRDEQQTIVTSNLTLNQLGDKLDDRISSRLAELCTVIELKGQDRRVKKRPSALGG